MSRVFLITFYFAFGTSFYATLLTLMRKEYPSFFVAIAGIILAVYLYLRVDSEKQLKKRTG